MCKALKLRYSTVTVFMCVENWPNGVYYNDLHNDNDKHIKYSFFLEQGLTTQKLGYNSTSKLTALFYTTPRGVDLGGGGGWGGRGGGQLPPPHENIGGANILPPPPQ